jgi:hypothetical protein
LQRNVAAFNANYYSQFVSITASNYFITLLQHKL